MKQRILRTSVFVVLSGCAGNATVGSFAARQDAGTASTDAGVSVKQLASELGYASVPAFSHAFRQVTGKTPTEFAAKA